jgi:hypothetical protein
MSQWLFPIKVVPVQAFSELVPMFMEPGEPTRPRDPVDSSQGQYRSIGIIWHYVAL